MTTYKKKTNFFETDEGVEIEQQLKDMAVNTLYNTESGYSANTNLYPDNVMSFVDKHKSYLVNHPNTDPNHYISNLRLMTRLK